MAEKIAPPANDGHGDTQRNGRGPPIKMCKGQFNIYRAQPCRDNRDTHWFPQTAPSGGSNSETARFQGFQDATDGRTKASTCKQQHAGYIQGGTTGLANRLSGWQRLDGRSLGQAHGPSCNPGCLSGRQLSVAASCRRPQLASLLYVARGVVVGLRGTAAAAWRARPDEACWNVASAASPWRRPCLWMRSAATCAPR